MSAGTPPSDAGTRAGRAPVAATATVLSAGTTAAAACFVVGFALALIGRPDEPLDPLDAAQLIASLAALRPAGWSTLGVLLMLLTPVTGLLASYIEMRVAEPRAAWLALGVLGVLAAAAVVAVIAR